MPADSKPLLEPMLANLANIGSSNGLTWLLIIKVKWHLPENNFTATAQAIIPYNKCEKN